MRINLAEINWSFSDKGAVIVGNVPQECKGTYVPRISEQGSATFDSGLEGWLEPAPDNDDVADRHLSRIAHLQTKD